MGEYYPQLFTRNAITIRNPNTRANNHNSPNECLKMNHPTLTDQYIMAITSKNNNINDIT